VVLLFTIYAVVLLLAERSARDDRLALHSHCLCMLSLSGQESTRDLRFGCIARGIGDQFRHVRLLATPHSASLARCHFLRFLVFGTAGCDPESRAPLVASRCGFGRACGNCLNWLARIQRTSHGNCGSGRD
jgi:hypothetical protein